MLLYKETWKILFRVTFVFSRNVSSTEKYTRSTWDLGLSMRHIFSIARRNDAE